jgi:protein gp37
MENSKIGWTTHTFNPWQGCSKVSPGCINCYAEVLGDRWGIEWGPKGERRRTKPSYWRKPIVWNEQAPNWVKCNLCEWEGFFGDTIPGDDGSTCPECWSGIPQPAPVRVFCGSMCDVFEESLEHPDLLMWRFAPDGLWDLVKRTPNLIWMLLTKRPENIQHLVPLEWLSALSWPHNVWIGTTIENQRMAEVRIPILLDVPARTRFLSCEPLLGPVNLTPWLWHEVDLGPIVHPTNPWATKYRDSTVGPREDIQWVIVGGESGTYSRPMSPKWTQSIRDQCRDAHVPFFFKQWGEWAPATSPGNAFHLKIPTRILDDGSVMQRVGKYLAGERLDGRKWHEFPNWRPSAPYHQTYKR